MSIVAETRSRARSAVTELLSPNLIATYAFKGGKQYVTNMRVIALRGATGSQQRTLELSVTDKCTCEKWQSSYDTAYIENLTHKTGNYKKFDVFVAMLQSGLLKTSDCVTLDLLTFEDLEILRSRRSEVTAMTSPINGNGGNRRYLILTYTVEFDRIHYPLPLEYCGPPDPSILQATIRRLGTEIEKLRTTGVNEELRRRFEDLTIINKRLVEENKKLASVGKETQRFSMAIKTLENNVAKERTSFRAQIQKLRIENTSLELKIRQLTEDMRRKSSQRNAVRKGNTPPPRSPQRRRSQRPESTSRSSSIAGRSRGGSLNRSPGRSAGSSLSRESSRSRATRKHNPRAKEIDFGNLESRIHALQKMLKDGINLN